MSSLEPEQAHTELQLLHLFSLYCAVSRLRVRFGLQELVLVFG